MAGEQLFESGINIGKGLTYQLDERKNCKGHFLDTPGLADQELRKQAGEAISAGLRKGGEYKVIFFVTESRGRVQAQDATTMKLVLDAAPEIGQNYGVVVNMVGKKVLAKIQDDDQRMKFLAALFVAIPAEQRCVYDHVIFFPEIDELEEKENALVSPTALISDKGLDLQTYLDTIVPKIGITEEKVNDVETDKFESLKMQLEQMAVEMQKKDEQWKMEMLRMERDRNELAAEMRRQEMEFQQERKEMEAKREEDMQRRDEEIERQRNEMYEEMRRRDEEKRAEMREMKEMDKMAIEAIMQEFTRSQATIEREKNEELKRLQDEANLERARMDAEMQRRANENQKQIKSMTSQMQQMNTRMSRNEKKKGCTIS